MGVGVGAAAGGSVGAKVGWGIGGVVGVRVVGVSEGCWVTGYGMGISLLESALFVHALRMP